MEERPSPVNHGRTPPARDTAINAHPIVYTGTGGEYFRVWVVNVLLTIVTLSLYTPWARRRTAQYFYSHTQVLGSPLEFAAEQRRDASDMGTTAAATWAALGLWTRARERSDVKAFMVIQWAPVLGMVQRRTPAVHFPRRRFSEAWQSRPGRSLASFAPLGRSGRQPGQRHGC